MRTTILLLLLAATAAGDITHDTAKHDTTRQAQAPKWTAIGDEVMIGPTWFYRQDHQSGDTFWRYADGTIKRRDCDCGRWGGMFEISRDLTEWCTDLADLDDYYVLRVDTIPVTDTTQIRAGVNMVFNDVPRYDTTWAPLVVVKLTPEQLERLMELLKADNPKEVKP